MRVERTEDASGEEDVKECLCISPVVELRPSRVEILRHLKRTNTIYDALKH